MAGQEHQTSHALAGGLPKWLGVYLGARLLGGGQMLFDISEKLTELWEWFGFLYASQNKMESVSGECW